jgi:hypothetical protein
MSRGPHVEQLPAMAKRWQLVCWTADPIAARICEEQRRAHVTRDLAQVLVIPGRPDTPEHPGGQRVVIPADAQAVAVGRLGAEPLAVMCAAPMVCITLTRVMAD